MRLPAAVVVTATALRRPTLQRTLVTFTCFSLAEWGVWVALLVWAYQAGGVRAASLVAVVQLAPGPSSACCAPCPGCA